MLNKLLAHQAVIDSVEVSKIQVLESVKRQVAYFKQQLGSEEKVVSFYGFDDMRTLKDALTKIETEKQLIAKEKQKIIEKISVSPEEVRVYYKGLEEKNELPEFGDEVSFAQISIAIKPTKEATEKTIDKLNEIRKDLINGSNFKMKALVYSKDPAVIENGGAYTINKESPFVREFKEVAFGLEAGEISKPFKTQFGYHIVKLEKIVGKNLEVRHILMNPEISDDDMKKAREKITAIRDSIKKGLSGKLYYSTIMKCISVELDGNANPHTTSQDGTFTLKLKGALLKNIDDVSTLKNTSSNIKIRFNVLSVIPDTGSRAAFFNELNNDGSLVDNFRRSYLRFETGSSIAGTTLSFTTGVADNADFTVNTHYAVVEGSIPAGTTLKLTKISSSKFRMFLNGKATSHTNADSTSFVVELKDAMFATGTDMTKVYGRKFRVYVNFND
uniref:peptidylprolyl isomerase n=1 Tax=Stylophora pistillata TaxID=50429 RepID=A0A2B4RDC4_STYPI